jgi:hypothetical protein
MRDLQVSIPREPNGHMKGQLCAAAVSCVLCSESQEFRTGFDIEFILDMFAMGLDRLDAEKQPFGDVLHRFAGSDLVENFQFPVGQAVHRQFDSDPLSPGHSL